MLRLVFTDGEFIARSDFASRRLPKEAGFDWSDERKTWYTRSLGVAYRLREFADESAKNRIKRALIRYEPWSGPLPYPKELTPYPYQKNPAATFALSRSKSYLGLAPRLGKTIVSALVINALQTPAIFITPPFLTRNIEAEFKRWLVNSPRIIRYDTKEAPLSEPEILIIADSLIHRDEVRREIFEFAESVTRLGIEPVLFVDEAHRYKTFKAARTRSLLGYQRTKGLIGAFPRQVYLSGTPMLNRPMELYPITSKVAPEAIDFMSETEYGMKFCDGKLMDEVCSRCHGAHGKYCYYCKGQGKFEHGYDFSGASNLAELQKRLYGKFMLRMKTVKGLPKRIEEMVIIGENTPRLIKMETKILAHYSPEDLVAGTVDSDHVATYRRELGLLKIKPAVDFLRSLLEDTDESIIVFAFHREVVAEIAEKLGKYEPLVIRGGISNEDRRYAEKEFQTNPKRRIIVANYIAAGLGLTLSKANRVVSVEYSWVPTENDQAGDRGRVVGGEDLYHQYLVFENSLDRKVIEVNFRKKRVTSYI